MKKSFCYFCVFLTVIFYIGCKSVPEETAAGKDEVLPVVSEETGVSGETLETGENPSEKDFPEVRDGHAEDDSLPDEEVPAADADFSAGDGLPASEIAIEELVSEDSSVDEGVAEDAELLSLNETDDIPEVEFEILAITEESDDAGTETDEAYVNEESPVEESFAEDEPSVEEIAATGEDAYSDTQQTAESQPAADEKTVVSEVSTVAAAENIMAVANPPVKEDKPKVSENKIKEIEKNYDKNCFRDFSMDMNQILYAAYPGSGWLFLGDEAGSDSIVFQKRDFSDTQTTFQLKSVKSGKALLHFYKKDVISNTEIHDFLKVSVSKKQASSLSVSAPAFKLTQFPEPAENGYDYSEDSYTDDYDSSEEDTWYSSIEDEPDVVSFYSSIDDDEDEAETSVVKIPETEDILFETFFAQALSAFEKEDYDQINDLLSEDNSFSAFEEDKYLYITGRFYEAKTEYRNINKAYDAYKKLVELYKESEYWPFAEKRLTYLNRFYYSIR